MTAENWKVAVLQGLKDLSDKDFQERVWLHHKGEEISTPSEAVCQLFDDTGLGEVLEDKVAFTPQIDKLLKSLSENIDRINLHRPVPELLASKEWHQIRTIASQAFNEVKKILDSGG